ncbi:hypothetical protein [Fibrobacter sp. UWR4]|uniref:hypothetical protein n=1 Tax=unclassified Fibrobacter TaxID=2634177 RepID=UPI0035186B79
MLGLWVSVDPKRQFASPYLYAGNGVNPVNGVDPDGKKISNLQFIIIKIPRAQILKLNRKLLNMNSIYQVE